MRRYVRLAIVRDCGPNVFRMTAADSGVAFPGPRMQGTGGTRNRGWLREGLIQFVLSHPGDKNKDVARVGHPRSCFPTDSAMMLRNGWGTQDVYGPGGPYDNRAGARRSQLLDCFQFAPNC